MIQITSYSEYERLEDRLRELQFHHSPEDAILCRYRYHGVVVDIMPTDVPSIGPTNKWYGPGMEHAISHELADGTTIKILTLPYFLATKFEAFNDRGGDMRTSKDFEDIVYLLDSRLELAHEVMTSPNDVRVYLREQFSEMLKKKALAEAIAGHLSPSIASARAQVLIERLHALVA